MSATALLNHALIVIVIFTFIQFHILRSETEVINTSINQEFYDQKIECSGTDACDITCDTQLGCYDTEIICPSQHECDVTCISETTFGNTCGNAQIYCPSTTGSCNIDCIDNSNFDNNLGSCANSTIHTSGKSDSALYLQCHGNISCTGSTIYCPRNADCIIECTNDRSCAEATIYQSATNDAVNHTVICASGRQSCWKINYETYLPTEKPTTSPTTEPTVEPTLMPISTTEAPITTKSASTTAIGSTAAETTTLSTAETTSTTTTSSSTSAEPTVQPTAEPTIEPTPTPTIRPTEDTLILGETEPFMNTNSTTTATTQTTEENSTTPKVNHDVKDSKDFFDLENGTLFLIFVIGGTAIFFLLCCIIFLAVKNRKISRQRKAALPPNRPHIKYHAELKSNSNYNVVDNLSPRTEDDDILSLRVDKIDGGDATYTGLKNLDKTGISPIDPDDYDHNRDASYLDVNTIRPHSARSAHSDMSVGGGDREKSTSYQYQIRPSSARSARSGRVRHNNKASIASQDKMISICTVIVNNESDMIDEDINITIPAHVIKQSKSQRELSQFTNNLAKLTNNYSNQSNKSLKYHHQATHSHIQHLRMAQMVKPPKKLEASNSNKSYRSYRTQRQRGGHGYNGSVVSEGSFVSMSRETNIVHDNVNNVRNRQDSGVGSNMMKNYNFKENHLRVLSGNEVNANEMSEDWKRDSYSTDSSDTEYQRNFMKKPTPNGDNQGFVNDKLDRMMPKKQSVQLNLKKSDVIDNLNFDEYGDFNDDDISKQLPKSPLQEMNEMNPQISRPNLRLNDDDTERLFDSPQLEVKPTPISPNGMDNLIQMSSALDNVDALMEANKPGIKRKTNYRPNLSITSNIPPVPIKRSKKKEIPNQHHQLQTTSHEQNGEKMTASMKKREKLEDFGDIDTKMAVAAAKIEPNEDGVDIVDDIEEEIVETDDAESDDNDDETDGDDKPVSPVSPEGNSKSNESLALIETDYLWIENALKQCDKNEWLRYLNNFKKHKLNEQRLKHIPDNVDELWKEIIPEIGVRYQFKSMWKQYKNK